MNKGLKKPDLKRSYRKRSNRPDLGFTMVELIVVITIVAIAAALTTLSVLKWQDWSNFNKQNEYAQALYSAAANQLTEYAGNGYLTEFADSLVKKDVKPNAHGTDYYDAEDYLVPVRQVSKLTDAKGNAYAGDAAVWKSLDKSGEGEFGTYIVILKAKAGDIGSVKSLKDAGTDSDKIQAYWIDRLLGSYVADREVLDSATISIEVAPEDGQVFALLYSDRTGNFIYDQDTGENEAHYNAANRKESYRSSFMVGYYGVDTLSKSIKGQAAADMLKLKKVRLINDESLHLAFNHANDVIEPLDTNYEIKVYDAEKSSGHDDLELTLKLDFPKLGTYMGLSTDETIQLRRRIADASSFSEAVRVEIPVLRHSVAYAGDSVFYSPEGDDLGNLPFLVWMNGKTVHLVLDAADMQATAWLYEHDYNIIHDQDDQGNYKDNSNDFKNTYSFFRFGQSTDNIKCTVKASAFTYADSTPVKSNTENPVFYEEKYSVLGFDSGYIKKTHKAGTQSFAYKLRNERHFNNIRYVEDPDTITTQEVDRYEADVDRQLSFVMDADLDWSAFVESGSFVSSGTMTRVDPSKLANINTADPGAYDFPSFRTLRKRDHIDGTKKSNVMTGHTEEVYSLKNFSISKISNDEYYVNLMQKQKEDDTGFQSVDNPVTGLILVNQGSLTNLTMDSSQIEGEDYVGAFTGINIIFDSSRIDNLTLENTDDKTGVTGAKNVGGIMGAVLPVTDKPTTVSNLYNKGRVSGEMAVGGIVGMSRNSFKTGKPAALELYIKDSDWTDSKKKITISDCINEGMIKGITPDGMTGDEEGKRQYSRYIGGIAGYLFDDRNEAEEVNISVSNCVSAPQYEAVGDLEDQLYGVYVGGIVGFNRYGSISNCSSQILEKPRGYVFGYKYVGGIVGMNIGPAEGTSIQGGVSPVNTNNVIGEYYVGGITGVNAAALNELSDGSEAGDKDPELIEQNKTEDSSVGPILVPDMERNLGVTVRDWTNKGVVIATKEYAGGITGYNAGWIYNCNSDIDPDSANAVFDKINEGKYCGDYVGGISGFNNGIIGTTDRYTRADEGPVGMKKGEDGKTLRSAVYVTGRNYVGGIVGYNAVDAIVENYEVSGGHVLGDPDHGYFIGGYAGLNVSMAMLMDMEESTTTEVADDNGETVHKLKTYAPRRIYSNPNEITGGYFVGGNIGGNLINLQSESFEITDSEDNKVYGIFRTNNFLGQIRDTHAFVGGFVGYNALFNTDKEKFALISAQILDEMEKLDEKYENAYSDDEQREAMLAEKFILMNDLKTNLKDPDGDEFVTDDDFAKSVVYITGEGEGVFTSSDLGLISADICVGGIMGYNDPNTGLYVRKARNATPVVAAYAIPNAEEQYTLSDEKEKIYRDKDYAGRSCEYRYSYAGGIIGKVERNTVLDDCSNTSTGGVTSKGTYTGALSELSSGLIINCSVDNFGSAAYDYVGGIVGLNEREGEIRQCAFCKRTISGRNVVGGIAAENAGLIEAIEFDSPSLSVTMSDDSDMDGVTGLYAAVNTDTGVLRVENDIKDVDISSKGRYAGGICGINQGALINARAADNDDTDDDDIDDDDNYIIVTGSITGYKNVGGIMGCNESTAESYTYWDRTKANDANYQGDIITDLSTSWFKNEASVTATNGNAGGIVGYNASKNVIEHCVNTATVSAVNEGNAGGITAENLSRIDKCTDTGRVKAPEGLCGGIVALNRYDEDRTDASDEDERCGVICKCRVWAPDYEDGKTEGRGTIADKDLLLFESKEKAGGICAENHGRIDACELKYVKVTNFANSNKDSAIGMYAGRNEEHGEILLNGGYDNTEGCKVRTYVNRCYVGGIAGVNRGKIEGTDGSVNTIPKSIVRVDVGFVNEGTGMTNMGGAAGWNKNGGIIQNVAIAGEVIGCMGDMDIGYGGIAGLNGRIDDDTQDKDPAVISGCSFDGVLKAKGSGASIARVGGIAGVNGYGALIEGCLIGVLGNDYYKEYKLDKNGKIVTDTSNAPILTGRSITKIFAGTVEDDKGERTDDVITWRNENTEFEVKQIDTSADVGSYAYIGGISGDNYGRVISCDNHKEDEEHLEGLSTDVVEIEAFKCMIGGIVGRSLQGSSIKGDKNASVSTGEDWTVTARDCDNNLGAGGIVGGYGSENDLAYLDNYAKVNCTYKSNTMAGGIAGYIYQNQVPVLKVYKCTNSGEVNVVSFAGGIIGDVEMSSLEMEDCINYGQVRALEHSAAGLVDYIKNNSVQNTFRNCINHGRVIANGGKPYGFVAELNGKSLYLIDCVNTGNLYSMKNLNKGISDLNSESREWYSFGSGQAPAYFDNCRDYSNGQRYNFANNNKRMQYCLTANALTPSSGDNSELSPIARSYEKNNNTAANFYIDKTTETDDDDGIIDASVINNRYITKLVKKEGTGCVLIPEGSGENFKGIELKFSDPYSDAYRKDIASYKDADGNYVYQTGSEHVYKRVYDSDEKGTFDEWKESGRIALYKELDPEYEKFIYSELYDAEKSLDTPENISRQYETGRYMVTCRRVDNAAAYEFYIAIKDADGVEHSSEIHTVKAGETKNNNSKDPWCYFSFSEIEELMAQAGLTWDDKDIKITNYVRAISGYHYLNADSFPEDHMTDAGDSAIPGHAENTCHSGWGMAENDLIRKIPAPAFHLEMTGSGKLVCVLDNKDEYEVFPEGYLNVDFHWSSKALHYDNREENYVSFSTDTGYSVPFELYNTGTHYNNNIENIWVQVTPTALAKNNGYNNYSGSEVTQVYGGVIDTKMHGSEWYMYNAAFSGLKGNNNSDLSYDVQLMVKNADFYTNAELLSPAPAGDPLEGIPVSYAHGWVHTAQRNKGGNTYFNMNLGELPSDLIGRDFEVRTYLYQSQSFFETMGHDVVKGVSIGSKEELSAIRDAGYFDESGNRIENSIYANGMLKPGYVLYLNNDGSYDIYYNASLECREKAGKDGKPYQVYSIVYKYKDGEYKVYSNGRYNGTEYEADTAPRVHTAEESVYRYYKNVKGAPDNYFFLEGERTGHKYEYRFKIYPDGSEHTDDDLVETIIYRSGVPYLIKTDGTVFGKMGSLGLDADITTMKNYENGGKYGPGKDTETNQEVWHHYFKSATPNYKFGIWHRGILKDLKTGGDDNRIWICDGSADFRYVSVTDTDAYDVELEVTELSESGQSVQPAPTISENYAAGRDNAGHDTYTFAWDQYADMDSPDYQDAKYSVQLYGMTVGTDEWVTITNVLDAGTDRTYTFTDSEDNWNYKRLKLEVTRLGETTDGYLSKFPMTSVRDDFEVLLKLDKLSVYGVNLLTDETGRFVTDDLDYRVVWDHLTNEYQLLDLAGYVIKVVDLRDENDEPVEEPNTHYYTVKVNEDPVFEADEGSIIYEPIESGTAEENSKQYYAFINLSDFDGGHTLGFSVQPIARKNADAYGDGDESNIFEKYLFTRLNTPVISSAMTDDDHVGVDGSFMTSYDDSSYDKIIDGIVETEPVTHEHAVDYETYRKGVTFDVVNVANYAQEHADTVTINLAAAVYDDCYENVPSGAGNDKERYFGGDTPEEGADGFWNSGAIKTPAAKEAPVVMSGKADAASFNLQLTDYEDYPGEYAGKWIKLAFMASKTNKISSSWTDEDLAQRDTVNYYWFHIPELVLDDVVIGDSLSLKSTYSVDPYVRYYSDGSLFDKKQKDNDATFEQVAFGFKTDYNAKGYAFDIKETAHADTENTGGRITPMYGVYLCKNDDNGGMDVYIKGLKNARVTADYGRSIGDKYSDMSDEDDIIPECPIEDGAVWAGHFDGDPEAGEQVVILHDIAHKWITSELEFKAYMTYKPGEDNAEVRLVLPDLQKTDSGANALDYIGTDSVLIQTVTGGAYHPGRRILWYRNSVGIGTQRKYILGTLSDYMTHDEAIRWFSEDSVMTEEEAEENLLGHEEDETVSENEISSEIEEVADEAQEEASGIETEAETEDHQDKAGDVEHDSDKPAETTDVQKDDDSSSSKSESSSSSGSGNDPEKKTESSSDKSESEKGDSGTEESKKEDKKTAKSIKKVIRKELSSKPE